MQRVHTISIATGGCTVNDIQIWSNGESGNKLASYALRSSAIFNIVSYVNHEMIPLHLLSMKPLYIYSDDDGTSEYFQKELIEISAQNSNIGLMVNNGNDDLYLVFYVDAHSDGLQIKCHVVDFGLLSKFLRAIENDHSETSSSSFVKLDTTSTNTKSSNTSIFDKVLSDKRRKLKSNQFIMPPLSGNKHSATPLSSLVLTTNDQITQAVSKIILSGLRIRGLNLNSSSQSTNEKIAIKEIYKMTHKSAMFSLRKFNYGFNNVLLRSNKNGQVELNDIQDVVEKLLQVFVDVDDLMSSSSTPKPFRT